MTGWCWVFNFLCLFCVGFNLSLGFSLFGESPTTLQGGRSCVKAGRAFAEKFWLGQKFYALTYAILSQYKDMSGITHFLGPKKCLWGQKQCFLGKRCTITWYVLHIILSWIDKFAITCKNDAFVAKKVNTRLTKVFMTIFALAERLPTSATLFRSNHKTIGLHAI